MGSPVGGECIPGKGNSQSRGPEGRLHLACSRSWIWTSMVVQRRLRLHALNAGGPGSIPGQGTRPHMPQLRPGTAE